MLRRLFKFFRLLFDRLHCPDTNAADAPRQGLINSLVDCYWFAICGGSVTSASPWTTVLLPVLIIRPWCYRKVETLCACVLVGSHAFYRCQSTDIVSLSRAACNMNQLVACVAVLSMPSIEYCVHGWHVVWEAGVEGWEVRLESQWRASPGS